jgi:hypothetical protein
MRRRDNWTKQAETDATIHPENISALALVALREGEIRHK